MKKYTRTYLIQLICIIIFTTISMVGLRNYDPENIQMFSIVGAVGMLIILAATLNFLSMRKKNRD